LSKHHKIDFLKILSFSLLFKPFKNTFASISIYLDLLQINKATIQ